MSCLSNKIDQQQVYNDMSFFLAFMAVSRDSCAPGWIIEQSDAT